MKGFFQKCIITNRSKKIDIFELIVLALIGGFVGVAVETVFVLLVDGVLVRRFLFVLPIVHVFVWATALIYLLFHSVLPKVKNIPIVFFISFFAMGSFEVIMGLFLNYLGIEMWNYSKFNYTITDYTTIPICLGWGILGISYVMVIQPIFLKILGKVPKKSRKNIMIFLVIVYLIDLIFSIIRAFNDPVFLNTLVYPS